MKTLTKILLPGLGIASVVIPTTSCTIHINGPQPISKDYLLVEDGILKGFKPEYEHTKIEETSLKLVVPKDVIGIAAGAFADKDGDADNCLLIKSVEFEEGSKCHNLGIGSFNGCTNLEEVIYGESYDGTDPITPVNKDNSLFSGCAKLKTIDISKAAKFDVSQDYLTTTGWTVLNGVIIHSGSVGQESVATKLQSAINATVTNANWQVQSKI